jgi:hypothetical protein
MSEARSKVEVKLLIFKSPLDEVRLNIIHKQAFGFVFLTLKGKKDILH